MVTRGWIRHFLILFLPGAALIIGGSVLYGRAEIERETGQIRSLQYMEVGSGADAVRHTLRAVSADVTFLANLPRLKQSTASPTAVNLAALAANFAAFAAASGVYDQIRWLDHSGRERVRVNLVDGRAVTVPEEQLQDKANRYYFADSNQLAAGTIYLSPFDLNIEQNQIEIPYKPTIRLATPLVDADGTRHGILILNYLGQDLLDALAAAERHTHTSLTLVNRDGYWLKGPRPDEEWGFMFGRDTATLGHLSAAAWKLISAAEEGQAELADGLWTWQTIEPSREISLGTRAPEARGTPMPAITAVVNSAGSWKAIGHLPVAGLQAIRDHNWNTLALIAAVLVIFHSVGSTMLARSQEHIVALNGNLRRRATEAEAASEAKARFLANMSHEIRTPMNAILGFAYLLEKSQIGTEERDFVHKLRVASQALLGIINDILDFSKIEAGRLEVERVPFRLSEVFDNLATILAANLVDRSLELIVGPPPEGVEVVIGDPLRLQQVLINLGTNAIKFTHSGEVSIGVAEDGRRGTDLRLRFSVRDTGIGIPADQQAVIFAPFTQADSSTTRRFGGTGLGLAISRSLVAAMGGEMGLTSSPGAGSEFWFSIPVATVPDHRHSVPAMAHLHLLVAAHNRVVREVLMATARSLNWTAEETDSGQAAVARLTFVANRHRHCDVILLDQTMPDLDGLSAAKAIRVAGTASEQSVIILMVAAMDRAEAQTAVDRSPGVVDAVLLKPVTGSSLYNAVGEALRRRDGDLPTVTQTSVEGPRLPGLRVLVVDDSDINREVARRILEGEGAVVDLAENGRLAVDRLTAHPTAFDVVVMDVQMPVMDGHEACRAIRGELGLSGLPIVALTAGAFRSEEEASLSAGMNAFVAKPIDVDHLIAVLQRLTGIRPQGPATTGETPASPAVAEPLVAAVPSTEAGTPGRAPPVDRAAALRVWGNEAVYLAYLRRFIDDNQQAGKRVANLLAAGDRTAATALAHQMKGVAGNLALPRVAEAAATLNTRLSSPDASVGDSPGALQAAIDEAAAAVSALAGGTTAAGEPAVGGSAEPDPAVSHLLGTLLHTLDQDNPDAVAPALAALTNRVPADDLSSIAARVMAFDFRGAETLTRAVADRLDLTITEDHGP